jgi:lysophospholipase L1-like esterase
MTPRTVMCFGDSNTHGTRALEHALDIRRFDRGVRWPGQMAAALGPDRQVIEEGHPSRTTTHDDPVEGPHKNGLSMLPALLESHRPLDLVIVMLGTNDLKMRYHVPAIDIAISTEKLLLTVAASIAGPDLQPPRCLLVAPVPIEEAGFLAEMFEGGAAKSRQLGPFFQTIAERHGAGFLDAGTLAKVDPTDGIHLTEAGHAALAAGIAARVAEMFP